MTVVVDKDTGSEPNLKKCIVYSKATANRRSLDSSQLKCLPLLPLSAFFLETKTQSKP